MILDSGYYFGPPCRTDLLEMFKVLIGKASPAFDTSVTGLRYHVPEDIQ